MRLTKHHGLGNDFIVALAEFNPGLMPDNDVSRDWCERRFSIGADGVLWGLPGREGADLTMVLHNSDGSEAEISGNGIRCLAQAWLSAHGEVDGSVIIDTAAGRRTLEATATDDPLITWISVDMGAVSVGPTIPDELAARLTDDFGRWESLSIGNPHLVVEVDDVQSIDLSDLGPSIEQRVPGGINVHVMAVSGPDHLELVHWERGAGLTLACGSGASVSAVAAHRWGLVGPQVKVSLPGGDAHVAIADAVVLSGPATLVALMETP